MSINMVPSQLCDPLIAVRLLAILRETGIAPNRIEIEITEDALVGDLEAAKHVLAALQNVGMTVALDDFGTGYSGLYDLRELHLDKIKVDQPAPPHLDPEGYRPVECLRRRLSAEPGTRSPGQLNGGRGDCHGSPRRNGCGRGNLPGNIQREGAAARNHPRLLHRDRIPPVGSGRPKRHPASPGGRLQEICRTETGARQADARPDRQVVEWRPLTGFAFIRRLQRTIPFSLADSDAVAVRHSPAKPPHLRFGCPNNPVTRTLICAAWWDYYQCK